MIAALPLLAAAPAIATTIEEGLGSLAAASGQEAPVLRIGLDSKHKLIVNSSRPFRILDVETGTDAWKPRYSGEVAVVAEGGPEAEVPSIFRVQVGAFASAEAAEAERARLERRFAEPAVARFIPDRGSWRVRLGSASERAALVPLMAKLRQAGVESLWVAEEPAEERPLVTLRVVDASYYSLATGKRRLVVVPDPGALLELDAKRYRGILELRVAPSGQVRAINWVGLEAYLLGVVPSELGPEVWPQVEAQKAQAVAARTYVMRHLGQFEDEGFDLCATPRCQVYGGASAEHPLSDRAVAATRGEILTWQGKPISALYTATCGGHTEDAGEIFPEEDAPYLKGVPCRAEGVFPSHLTVPGRAATAVLSETGDDVTRDIALLTAAGALEKALDPIEAGKEVAAGELRAWTAVVAQLSGRPQPSGKPLPIRSLGDAAVALVADLGWEDRAKVLLADEDVPALLRDPEAASLPPQTQRALAYLVGMGGLRPMPDGKLQVERLPSRARLLPALVRVGEAYNAFGLREATVAGLRDGILQLAQGRTEVSVPMADRPYTFGLIGGRVVPAQTLALWPGDRVRYRTGQKGRLDFLELRPPVKGTSNDRTAAVYSWEVRRTRTEIESAIGRSVHVGALLDLIVLRRGTSGRIVELRVVGDAGTTVVKGFDIRTLLDLRETFTVIEPQRDSSGRIQAVVFAGKGWGHGVGLCQVGAFGMALQGAGYRDILEHYYRGAVLGSTAAKGP